MVIPKIPNNVETSFSEVDTLSPSVFTQIKDGCKFKYILQKSVREKTKGMGISLTYPPGQAALYGSIIHLMFEKRMKGLIPDTDSFERVWENEVEKVRNDLKSKYPLYNFKNDYSKMFDAEDVVMNMTPVVNIQNGMSSNSNQMSSFERPYKIPDMLYGKIDRISFENGKTEIIDYKTGNVFDENGIIKQIYIDQLNLYALLYETVENASVDKLTIIDKQGSPIDVPIIKDKTSLANEVCEIIKQIHCCPLKIAKRSLK